MKEKKFLKIGFLLTILFLGLMSQDIKAQDKKEDKKEVKSTKPKKENIPAMVTYTDSKGVKHTVTKKEYEKYKKREVTDEELHAERLKRIAKRGAEEKKGTPLNELKEDEDRKVVEDQ